MTRGLDRLDRRASRPGAGAGALTCGRDRPDRRTRRHPRGDRDRGLLDPSGAGRTMRVPARRGSSGVHPCGRLPTTRARRVEPMSPHRTSRLVVTAAAVVAAAVAAAPAVFAGEPQAVASSSSQHGKPPTLPGGYRHLVVIYEENHSFDNLYGLWGEVHGQHVDGLPDATTAQSTQVAQDGAPYACLPQDDVNLTSPPLSSTCSDAAHGITASHFGNRPFSIDDR